MKTLDELTDAFLASINLRQLAKSRDTLADIETLAAYHAPARIWRDYCRGVLVFEIQRDWAKAERIFTTMLSPALDPPMRCRVLYAVGRTYIVQGRWTQATDNYKALIEFASDAKLPIEVIKARRQIAICYCKAHIRGDFTDEMLIVGIRHCNLALAELYELGRKSPTDGLAWIESSLWSAKGTLLTRDKQLDHARACHLRDLKICRMLGDQHGIGLTFNNLGEVYFEQGRERWQKAQSAFTRARRLTRAYGNAYDELDVLRNLGRLMAKMDENRQARAHYRSAIELIERLRAGNSSDEGRTGFFTTVSTIYAEAVKLSIDGGDLPSAFEIVERSRARALVELLAHERQVTSHKISPDLLAEIRALREELEAAFSMTADARDDTSETEQRLADLEHRIRLQDPEFANIQTVHSLSYRQIVKKLPANKTLIVYFAIDENIAAFVLGRRQLSLHRLELTVPQLQSTFDENGYLHRLLPVDGKLHKPSLLSPLYRHLITPLSSRLEPGQQLVFVPFGILHFIPFSALIQPISDDKEHALLDDHEVVIAPSVTLLLEQSAGRPPSRTQGTLAFGFDAENLRYAEREAISIAELTGGHSKVGNEANRENLYSSAQHYRWLHLSAHGQFNAETSLLSYLQLADGPLYATDILRSLRLNADLVTLSACETGRSSVLRGEELIGLVRAIMFAGTPMVLVTLWPVYEVSTSIFMRRFYQNLFAGATKAASLREAQLFLRRLTADEVSAMLRDMGQTNPGLLAEHRLGQSGDTRIFAHPYYWAPFILIGDQDER